MTYVSWFIVFPVTASDETLTNKYNEHRLLSMNCDILHIGMNRALSYTGRKRVLCCITPTMTERYLKNCILIMQISKNSRALPFEYSQFSKEETSG